MKRMYLHIGLPKTGTSYIQAWLHSKKDLLKARRVWTASTPKHGHRMAVEFIKDQTRIGRHDIPPIKTLEYDVVQQDLMRGLSDAQFESGVISSEYFIECKPQDLNPVVKILGDTEIAIILYLRRQDRMIESAYNQEVKAMRATHPISPPRYFAHLDWLKLYEAWAEVFGAKNIRIINYDRVTKSAKLLESFLRAVDLPEDLAKDPVDISTWQNQSLPANLLEFKRLANVIDFPDLEQWLFDAISAGIPVPQFHLSSKDAIDYLKFYEESNKKLSSLMCNGEETLFPPYIEEPSSGQDFTNRLPIATVVQLFALHLKMAKEQNEIILQRLVELEKTIKLERGETARGTA